MNSSTDIDCGFIFTAAYQDDNLPPSDAIQAFNLTQTRALSSLVAVSPLGPPPIEPTPIDYKGTLEAVPCVQSLPVKMKQYCEEYIAALSHLLSDFVEEGPSCPEAPTKPQCEAPPATLLSLPTVAWSLPLDEPAAPTVPDSSCDDSVGPDSNMKVHPYQQERWMNRYQDLVTFRNKYDHCNVPYGYKENPCLGQWVKRQRHQYKLLTQGNHSNLDLSRIQALGMLGFIWDSHGAAWEENFQDLKKFHKLHGHVNIPSLYRGSSQLSTWIKRQRRQYRLFMAGKQSTMDDDRIQRLESLSFVWDYYGKGNDA